VSDGALRGAVAALSLAGIAVTGYLLWARWTSTELLCSTGGCETVQSSSYAELLGVPVAAALLLGAVLAPTDPVLATAVAVNDADDHDRMRYGISGEAGLNDGTAFPFVVFALAWGAHDGPGTWIFEWAAVRVLWAIPAALLLGFYLGKLIGRLAIALRTRQRDSTAPSDLLALALIGIAYVTADAIHAWGFLAVFAAGLGLRAAEVDVVTANPHPDAEVAPLLCAGLIGYRSLRKAGEAGVIGVYGFGAAAHILTQVARHEGRKVLAFTRRADLDAQRLATELGAAWAGSSDEEPPEGLDAAIIFAPVGSLVVRALRAVRPGGVVVCGGIHMTDVPSFPYELLWGERTICSVANLTRRDGEEFLALAARVPVRTRVEVFPLAEANEALTRLREGRIRGAAVLVTGDGRD